MASALTPRGSTTRWRKIRAGILTRDQHTCRYCGARANTVDHVVPRSQGGGDHPANLVASCRACNGKKGGRLPHLDHPRPIPNRTRGLGLDEPGPLGRPVIH